MLEDNSIDSNEELSCGTINKINVQETLCKVFSLRMIQRVQNAQAEIQPRQRRTYISIARPSLAQLSSPQKNNERKKNNQSQLFQEKFFSTPRSILKRTSFQSYDRSIVNDMKKVRFRVCIGSVTKNLYKKKT